ncbi:hypothetical protein Bra3105_18300 [Brachybacterium halotolerans subsp. kimchii]|uniref:hypothetical protein n=1 Tax=Brachybacterium halotolerans TaxID=2795215 RepID=UPI001E3C6B9A|nr:hypothetical protein [Brachybacterium halotolerans]UEJ82750.1 hypothetical protein Bra3105_18300 [Brachybacterium halotolerans subsp. kimchii]
MIAVDPMTEPWQALNLEALGGRVVRPVTTAGTRFDPLVVVPEGGHAEDEEGIS